LEVSFPRHLSSLLGFEKRLMLLVAGAQYAVGCTRTTVSIDQHARNLRNLGYTVVEDAGLPRTLVDEARRASGAEFEQHLEAVSELGLDPFEDTYAFKELSTRHKRRWNLRPNEASAWTRLVDSAVHAASPVIEACVQLPPHADDDADPSLSALTRHLLPSRPSVDAMGAILSAPGAKAQRFHADAGETHLKVSPRGLEPPRCSRPFAVPMISVEGAEIGSLR
jgi:hypothetical protein